MSKQVGLDLENLYAYLTNMAFVKEPEGWMGFQQAWMPGMAYQKKKSVIRVQGLVCWEYKC